MHRPEFQGKKGKFRVVAACDLIRSRRDAAAREWGCKTYRNIADLIADPDVELVDVATRSCDHYDHAMRALRAGKDVFLEKPICETYAEAKRLRAASQRSRGTLYVRHNRRFDPDFLHVREIIRSGVLGRVYAVKQTVASWQRRDDWQTLLRCGGGQLLNWGPHLIDHALRFLESPVAEQWSDLKRIAAVGDAEDHVDVILKGKNGRVAEVLITGGGAIGGPRFLVLGTKGALSCDGATITVRHLDPKRKLRPRRAKSGTPGETFGTPDKLRWIEKTVPVKPGKQRDIVDALYRAMREGKPFPITLDEALAVMRVISAARRGTPFVRRR